MCINSAMITQHRKYQCFSKRYCNSNTNRVNIFCIVLLYISYAWVVTLYLIHFYIKLFLIGSELQRWWYEKRKEVLLYAHRHRSILGPDGHNILTPANHWLVMRKPIIMVTVLTWSPCQNRIPSNSVNWRNSIEFHGIFHGIPWNSINLSFIIPWNFMENSMENSMNWRNDFRQGTVQSGIWPRGIIHSLAQRANQLCYPGPVTSKINTEEIDNNSVVYWKPLGI
jgi:hypothetical protein